MNSLSSDNPVLVPPPPESARAARDATSSVFITVAAEPQITKVYFPREIIPFSTVFVALVDFAVGSVLLVALMAYYEIAPTAAIAFLPVVLLVHVIFTMALAMANLFYRDVKYLFEIGAALRVNPMTPIIDAYRDVLLRGELPEVVPFAAAAVVAVVALGIAWTSFHAAEGSFAENV